MLINALTDSPFVRVFVYFLIAGSIAVALPQLVPGLQEILVLPPISDGVGLGDALGGSLESGRAGAPDLGLESLLARGLGGLLTLAGSLVWGVPLAWTYVVTRRQEGFRRSFVQMLIFLPLVVAGVARVVRGDLALAFALAGIVAAVRFRTTVRDPKNAVFAFGAIGIGLSAGSGSWVMAGVLSAVFCFVALVLWRADVGGLKPILARSVGALRLSEALVPGELKRTVAIGETTLVEPLGAGERAHLPDRVAKLAYHVRTDALRKKKKFQQLLLVYAQEREKGCRAVEAVLERHVARWQLVDTFPWRDDAVALEYLIRLDDEVDVSAFLDAFACSGGCLLRAAEIKPMAGLRSRLTS